MSKFIRYLSENTSIPFKTIVPVVATLLGCTVWLTSLLYEIRGGIANAWTVKQQQLWTEEMRERNPSMRFIEPLKVVAESKDNR